MDTDIIFADYLKPELAILIPALYTAVQIFRKAHLPERFQPFVVLALSLLLCTLHVFSVCDVCTPAKTFAAAFTSITQGLIVSGVVIYGDYHLTKPK